MIRISVAILVALALVSGRPLWADDVADNIEKGTQALHAEDYDKAIDLFNQVLQVDPTNVYALVCRGIAHCQKKDPDRALADLSAALQLDPNDFFAYANRGNAYYQKGDFDKAVEDYNQAIAIDPQNARAFIRTRDDPRGPRESG
ncbi:MAG TPA: tetratricopeptide repeat protein [Gemmataceae bacterium]|nr:tetratricopeptide repeat protein [Gemmataceae bacterium]